LIIILFTINISQISINVIQRTSQHITTTRMLASTNPDRATNRHRVD